MLAAVDRHSGEQRALGNNVRTIAAAV